MKIGGVPGKNAYGSIISAAFRHKEFDLGWSLMTDVCTSKTSELALTSYLQYCEKTEESIVKLLDFMDCYEIFPTADLINEIGNYFQTYLNYERTETHVVAGRGTCRHCNTLLEKNELTVTEYKMLTESFMNNVFQDQDIFLNTRPEELKYYKDFIAKSGPFDIILDGLNIAFARGRSSTKYAALNVEFVVSTYARQGKRVLVIGRKHMDNWPRQIMENIRKLGHVHLIQDDSNDDPFIIYAALKSGPHAKFISKDLMRNHTFRLKDPKLSRLFKRWRLSHQLSFETRGPTDFKLIPFTSLLPVPQKNKDNKSWHIPYDTDKLVSPYSIPTKWLCLTPKRNK